MKNNLGIGTITFLLEKQIVKKKKLKMCKVKHFNCCQSFHSKKQHFFSVPPQTGSTVFVACFLVYPVQVNSHFKCSLATSDVNQPLNPNSTD